MCRNEIEKSGSKIPYTLRSVISKILLSMFRYKFYRHTLIRIYVVLYNYGRIY